MVQKIEIQKSVFKKVLKNHSNYINRYGNNILKGLVFLIKDKTLEIVSTDGNRLLLTKIPLPNDTKNMTKKIYDGRILTNLNFQKNLKKIKGLIEPLFITFKKDKMEILDAINKITYNIPALSGKYPNYERLLKDYQIKKEDKHEIILNRNYMLALKDMIINEKTQMIKLSFDKNNNIKPIFINAIDENSKIKQTSLIMPMEIR